MGALLALLPTILSLMNNPDIQKLLPLLMQLGQGTFPNVDPNKAGAAGAALFDVNSVKWVQAALNLMGEKLEVDGTYGDDIKAAVKTFQVLHNLKVDGWAGSLTQDAMRASIAGWAKS